MQSNKQNRPAGLTRSVGGSLFLIILAASIGLGVNALRSEGLPLVQDWEATLNERNRTTMPGELETLDVAQMTTLYQRQDVLVLDARPEDFWKFERIPGSKSLPVENAELLIPELLSKITPDIKIITYCDGGSCHASRELGEKILQAGHQKVAVFVGGIEEWLADGKPIESDENG